MSFMRSIGRWKCAPWDQWGGEKGSMRSMGREKWATYEINGGEGNGGNEISMEGWNGIHEINVEGNRLHEYLVLATISIKHESWEVIEIFWSSIFTNIVYIYTYVLWLCSFQMLPELREILFGANPTRKFRDWICWTNKSYKKWLH